MTDGFLDLSTYKKRADWIIELCGKWKQMKKDMDRLIEVVVEFILKDKND